MRKKKIRKILGDLYWEIENNISATTSAETFERLAGEQILIIEIAEAFGISLPGDYERKR